MTDRPAPITPHRAERPSGPAAKLAGSRPAGTRSARRARRVCQPRARSAAEATISLEALARVTSAAPHCGVSRSWKKGRVSSDIAGCPFRCHRISGGSKDTTSRAANRQNDLPRHAQQRSLGSQWQHSGPVQPRPPTRDRPPTSGRLRPAQRCFDLRRCDTANSAQPPLARCQRPARQTPTDTSRKILEKTSYSPHKRRPRHASDQ